MTFVNFEEIKANYPIADVAERLGLKLTKSGNTLRGPCPSGEGGERALVITPSKGVYYSFAKEKGGDVIALVSFVNNIEPKQAALWITGGTVPAKNEKPEAKRGFRQLDYLEHDHPAVLALGIEPEDAKRLGIGYAPRGILKGTVAVPIRLEDGTLVGYVGATELRLPPEWKT